jgi:NDP-sugar pyrophosphorylase family protein
MKAMILAAGRGTRLKPFTETKPKVLFEVAGHTLLEITIKYLKRQGISEFIINVHHFADQVIDYLKKYKGFGLSYVVSDESDELMNSGGAIVKVKDYLLGDEPFLLTAADILTNLDIRQMFAYHQEKKPLVTLAVKDRPTSRSLLFNDNYQLIGWRHNETGELKGNKARQAVHDLGFSTIHIIQPELFDYIDETGAFSIMDLYLRLMETKPIVGYRHDDREWFEFGRTDRIREMLNNPTIQEMLSKV